MCNYRSLGCTFVVIQRMHLLLSKDCEDVVMYTMQQTADTSESISNQSSIVNLENISDLLSYLNKTS